MNQDNNDKRKGGRPRKSSVSRKSKTIGVCFSEPELYAVRHRVAKARLPISVYCHDAILDGVIREKRGIEGAVKPDEYGQQPERHLKNNKRSGINQN